MGSTYTDNGGIEKIGLGEQAGAWGTTTNNNFDIIDRLVNGVGSISLTGTTHTLTTSDGSLSEGMYKVLVLGGSPSGTNTITISPNNADKLYFVKNASGQSATFTQGSGADVTIANGDGAIIYADGAGSGAAVTSLSALFPNADTSGAGTFSTLTANGGVSVDNITIDGTEIDLSSGDLTIDVEGDIILDSNDGLINFKDNGTEIAYIQNASGSLQIQSLVSDGDIKLRGNDGGSAIDALVLDMSAAGNATFNGTITTPGLTLGSTAITATGAELNYTDGVTSNIQTQINAIMPSGALMPYAGASAPTGFLLCDGSAISRSTYSGLFSAISTTYGTGDGSSTFNIPDLRGRVVAGQDDMGGSSANRLTDQTGGLNGDTLGDTGGSETHTLTTAQMPAHTHTVAAQQQVGGDSTNRGGSGQLGAAATITSSSTGGDGAHNNVQPTIILNYIIKT